MTDRSGGVATAPNAASAVGVEVAGLFWYEGTARQVVTRLKFDFRRDAVPQLGVALAVLAQTLRTTTSCEELPFDAVTNVPALARNIRERGFDQGEELARATAKALGLRHISLLRRVGGVGQTGASRTQRLAGPTLELRQGTLRRRRQRSVLLIDDVMTTGASIASAAAVLRRGGHSCDSAVVVAINRSMSR